jgi:mannan endo-1,4-beta-mannosidase
MPGRTSLPLLALLALPLGACGDSTGSGGTSGKPGPEPPAPTDSVAVSMDVAADRSPISPYVYGSNQDRAGSVWTVRRLGGNRLTGYDWENNYSSAGSDFQQSSDDYLVWAEGVPAEDAAEPAAVPTHFHDRSLEMGAESILTLQMAGYVAADGQGPVSEAQTAPSPRWVEVRARKGAPFDLVPDRTDGAVYMDELVNLLVSRYGPAGSDRGVRWYSLDNEPALWSSTHPRIHPEPVGAAELVDRSIELAAAVKDVDPGAGILGPALYGMGAFATLQDAPDWPGVKGAHDWFIDYYLDRMRQAEASGGRRLLDVLDVHWYPEARGDRRITEPGATTPADVEARLQAPRSLWDPTYREDSWIAQYLPQYLPLLPRLRTSIDRYYPGTELAITEYDYGAGDHVSGGLAQADVLGAFGRYGVRIATLWGIEEGDAYTAAAFSLYRNYDGRGARFGSTSVRARVDDPAKASVYASIDGDDPSTLHVVLINKRDHALRGRFTVANGAAYSTGEVWGFDASGPAITARPAVEGAGGGGFSYDVPAYSAVHLVLRR